MSTYLFVNFNYNNRHPLYAYLSMLKPRLPAKHRYLCDLRPEIYSDVGKVDSHSWFCSKREDCKCQRLREQVQYTCSSGHPTLVRGPNEWWFGEEKVIEFQPLRGATLWTPISGNLYEWARVGGGYDQGSIDFQIGLGRIEWDSGKNGRLFRVVHDKSMWYALRYLDSPPSRPAENMTKDDHEEGEDKPLLNAVESVQDLEAIELRRRIHLPTL